LSFGRFFNHNQFFIFIKLPLAGFDLSTHNAAVGKDTTRSRKITPPGLFLNSAGYVKILAIGLGYILGDFFHENIWPLLLK
jgi:hypothetical protein